MKGLAFWIVVFAAGYAYFKRRDPVLAKVCFALAAMLLITFIPAAIALLIAYFTAS